MSRQICTFMVGDLLFGLDVLRIQEIIRPQAITRVPLAPPMLRGLINLRGQILTAFDLREKLGLPPVSAGHASMNIIALTPAGPVGLLVDHVGEVLTLTGAELEPPPAHLHGPVRQVIEGIYKLKDQLLLLLDLPSAIATDHAVPFDSSNPLKT